MLPVFFKAEITRKAGTLPSKVINTNNKAYPFLQINTSSVDHQVWQCGSHLGARWASTAGVHNIWGSSTRDQRHPLQEASSRLFPVKSLSGQPWCVEISGSVSHQPPSILLLDSSVGLNREQFGQKACQSMWMGASLSLRSRIFFFVLTTLPKSDRAVAV